MSTRSSESDEFQRHTTLPSDNTTHWRQSNRALLGPLYNDSHEPTSSVDHQSIPVSSYDHNTESHSGPDIQWRSSSYQNLSAQYTEVYNHDYQLPMPMEPRPAIFVHTEGPIINTRSPGFHGSPNTPPLIIAGHTHAHHRGNHNTPSGMHFPHADSNAHALLPSSTALESTPTAYPRIERRNPYANPRSSSAENRRDPLGRNNLHPDNWETASVSDPETGPMGSASPSPIGGRPPVWSQYRVSNYEPGAAPQGSPPGGDSSAGHTSSSASDSDESSSMMISSSPMVASTRGTDAPNSVRRTTGPRRNKMHTCTICQKQFPRPSGLKTHLNSHTGDRPFECPAMGCGKKFTVLSNAKRHLRTHAPEASSVSVSPEHPRFQVGFETPVVAQPHQSHNVGGAPQPQLRWVRPGAATYQGDEWEASGSGPSSHSAPVAGPSSGAYSQGPFPKTEDYDDMYQDT